MSAEWFNPTCSPIAPTDPEGRLRDFNPHWLTDTVLTLTFGIEGDQAFDRLPILADALEEAGCDDQVLLAHCRHCPVHAPNCWAVGLILGRPTAVDLPSSPVPPAAPPATASLPAGAQSEPNITPVGLAVRVVLGVAFLWALSSLLGPLCERLTTRDITHLTAPRHEGEKPVPVTQPTLTAEQKAFIRSMRPGRVVNGKVIREGDPGWNDVKPLVTPPTDKR